MPLPIFAGFTKALIGFLTQSEVVLLFAGDAMQHKAQLDAADNGNGIYSYTECFEPIKGLVQDADFATVNLETPLGGHPYRGYPCFSAPDSYAEALVETGFDLILTANNHTLDARDRGVKRTINTLDSLAIPHIGSYINACERENKLPLIINIKGYQVGFLNYTYGTNGIGIQGDVVVDYIDKELIARDISLTRKAGAEILCVAMHWGDEYQLLPNKYQKTLAKWLCDQGVDIIFGGHPHVVQPMELIDNKITGRKTALFYSLGNFISNMNTRDTRGGAISRVILKRDSIGRAYVDDLSYELVFTVPPIKKGDTFRLYPANDTIFEGTSNCDNNLEIHLPTHIIEKRDAFVSSATNIFNQHNKNVSNFKSEK